MKNKLLLTSLSIVMALGMLLVMAVPVAAYVPPAAQTWNLDSNEDQLTDPLEYPLPNLSMAQMEKVSPPAFTPAHSQSGSVDIVAGGSQVWIADQAALVNVTFGGGAPAWILELVTDKWDDIDTGLKVEIGYADATYHNFDAIISDPTEIDIVNLAIPPDITSTTYSWHSDSVTVPVGKYLALRLTNNSGDKHTVYTGENDYSSCLTSTPTDPGYPLPEIASGIAFAAGLLGIGGFILIRRRQAVVNS
jgi:hypothetical protein